MIHAIWAEDEAHLIGANGTLPWHLPADLQHFKNLTLDNVIVMGSVTHEGMQKKLLPNRINIILTRNTHYQIQNGLVMNDIESCIQWYQNQTQEIELFIIGGAQIIKAFESYIDIIHRTVIHHKFVGDTYFPDDFNWKNFQLISTQLYLKDAENKYDFEVQTFNRN